MKKKLIFSAMLVCVLALGFVIAGCKTDDGGSNPNDGTWSNGDDRLILSGTNYTFRQNYGGTLMDISKGTFTADLSAASGTITINQTHEISMSTGQLAPETASESGTFAKSGNSMTLSGFSNFPVNGTWTK
ncbi:MAG: hypothetical protein LBG95_07755 [Treponema sp.]|nr:hypothetical protein [Treponema sp.]